MSKPTNQQLMEQMAEKFVHDKPDSSFTKVFEKLAFKEGWQARDKVLLEAGVEFDKSAAREAAKKSASEEGFLEDTDTTKLYQMGYKHGCGWQHSQLTAIYEAKLADMTEQRDHEAQQRAFAREDCLALGAIIAKLESELKAALYSEAGLSEEIDRLILQRAKILRLDADAVHEAEAEEELMIKEGGEG